MKIEGERAETHPHSCHPLHCYKYQSPPLAFLSLPFLTVSLYNEQHDLQSSWEICGSKVLQEASYEK